LVARHRAGSREKPPGSTSGSDDAVGSETKQGQEEEEGKGGETKGGVGSSEGVNLDSESSSSAAMLHLSPDMAEAVATMVSE